MKNTGMKSLGHNSPHPDSANSIIALESQEDANLRRSQAMKRHFRNTEYRTKKLAILQSEEAKLRSGQLMKRRFQNPKFREAILARLHSPEAKEKARLAYVKRLREDPAVFKKMAEISRERILEQLKQRLGGEPKEVLEDLHIKQGLSVTDIANRFHMPVKTVRHWFKRSGIPLLWRSQAAKRRWQNPEYREKILTKRHSQEQLKRRLGGDPKEVLEDLHIKQGLSAKDIAEQFHVTREAVYYWFEILGITMIPHYRTEQLKRRLGGDPKEVLEDLHIKQGLSAKDIAEQFHVTREAVYKRFKKLGIPLNKRSMSL